MRSVAIAAGTLAALLVAACVTSEGYDRQTATWVGLPIEAVIAEWGPPNRSIQLAPDETTYEWTRVGRPSGGGLLPFAGFAFGLGIGSGGHVSVGGIGLSLPLHAAAGGGERSYCTTRFTVGPDGLVSGYTFEGDDCVAQAP